MLTSTSEPRQNQIDQTDEPINQARDQLIIAHLPFAKKIARRMLYQLPGHVDRNDLMSAAIIGLIMAAERFEPSRDIKFTTFAEQRIRGTIIDELRSQDWLSRSLRDKYKTLEREFSTLEQTLGRDPTSEEVAKAMGISLEEYFQLLDEVHNLAVISLDDSWEDSSGNPFGLLDVLENKSAIDPHDQMIEQQTADILFAAINDLPAKEREIVSCFYYEDRSLKQIGEVMHLNESRVCQLHGQAIMRLRVKVKSLSHVSDANR